MFPPGLFPHQPFHNLVVGILHAAKIPAEPVLVQFFAGLAVPEPAGVRRNLVREDDRPVAGSAELELEVDQLDPKVLDRKSVV